MATGNLSHYFILNMLCFFKFIFPAEVEIAGYKLDLFGTVLWNIEILVFLGFASVLICLTEPITGPNIVFLS